MCGTGRSVILILLFLKLMHTHVAVVDKMSLTVSTIGPHTSDFLMDSDSGSS